MSCLSYIHALTHPMSSQLRNFAYEMFPLNDGAAIAISNIHYTPENASLEAKYRRLDEETPSEIVIFRFHASSFKGCKCEFSNWPCDLELQRD